MNFNKKDYIKELCVEELTPVDILKNIEKDVVDKYLNEIKGL